MIVVKAANTGTPNLTYTVSVARKANIAWASPSLPAIFTTSTIRSGDFRRFLLAKAINAEHAACKSGILHEYAVL